MADIWFSSDLHLGHANILTFTGEDGKLIRPGFSSIEEHDEKIIEAHNSVVKPGDKWYCMGDFSFNAKYGISCLKRMNGKKRLVVGNHDPIKELAPYFEKVLMWRIFKEDGFVCTHVPLAKEFFRFCTHNVHGHIHQNLMKGHVFGEGIPDVPSTRGIKYDIDLTYINVCMERLKEFRPINMDEVKSRIASSS